MKTIYKPTIIGWIIVLIVLYSISKTKTGYSIIYYSLLLSIVLLVVGQYQGIKDVMIKEVQE
jgi:hypothetical protein